ncbi:MAG: hypothetical protein ACUVWP_05190 [bacterium]
MPLSVKFILILILISHIIILSQQAGILYYGRISHQYRITISSNGSEGPYTVPVDNILENTIVIYINNKLVQSDDYKILDNGKTILFAYPISYGYSIDIYFNTFEIKETNEVRPISKGGSFNITGSKNFTVSTAGGGETTIDQGTRLRFYGTVSGLEVEGHLTDEQMPITPEGSSEELADIDQIMVRVKGYGMNLEMGDIFVEGGESDFLLYNRYLLGATGSYRNESFSGSGTLSIARGEHTSVDFKGEDGIQGPYMILVPNAYSMTVIPLSERVYLNGELLKRGDNMDYTIDYYKPSITFTKNRLITSSSRIYIEFDYSELGYRRKFYAGRSGINLRGGNFKINFETALEEDDPQDDLIGLTGDDRKRLFNAGDDSKKSFRTARDENGNPIYEYVGQGKGNYKRQWDDIEKKYVYIYVGDGLGDYRQVTYYLPMPQKRLVFDINNYINIGKRVNIKLGLATSNCDLNLISPFNDDDNIGSAMSFKLTGRPYISNKSILTISGSGYKRDSKFNSIDNVERAEDLKRWEIEEEETNPTVFEYSINSEFLSSLLKRLSFDYAKTSRLFDIREGKFDKIFGDLFQTEFNLASNRFGSHKIDTRFIDKLMSLRINNNDITDGEREQKRHYVDIMGRSSRKIAIIEPYLIYDYNERFLDRWADNCLDKGSIRLDVGGGLSINPTYLSLDINHKRLSEKEASFGNFYKSYKGSESNLTGRLSMRPFTLDFGGTVRRVDYLNNDKLDIYQDVGTATFTTHPLSENTTITARYKITSEREYEREEVFIIAKNKDGDYRREEDPNNPGRYIYVYDPEDEDAIYIRVLRPTGEFYPISGVDGLLSISYEKRTGVARLPLTFSGYISVSERTRDKRRGRVFTFLSIISDLTVKGDVERSLSMTLFPNNIFFSPRLSYNELNCLERIITEIESRRWSRTLYCDIYSSPAHFLSINYGGSYNRFTEETSSEGLGVVRTKNGWEYTLNTSPQFNILSNLSLKTTFTETIRFERNDNLSGRFLVSNLNPSILYSPYSRGSITIDYALEWVRARGHKGTIYIFTHPEGVSHNISCSFRHQMPQYITLRLSYILEKDPEEPFDYKVMFDVSAFF